MTLRQIRASDGRTLEVFESGDLNGIPVIVHHGTPGSGLLYRAHVRDAAEQGIRLIGYSRPGYGHSTSAPGRTVATAAHDVETICDALGLARICTWGHSGGGPHALACAALLPDRVACASSLASLAPYDADGLDWLNGMGQSNLEEWEMVGRGTEALLPFLEQERDELDGASPEHLLAVWSTLFCEADAAIVSGVFARHLLEDMRHAVGQGLQGWMDDDLALFTSWGFDVSQIAVPVLLWQGREDRFVPFAHGEWLAARIPNVDARLTEKDGHLTLFERCVPDVHGWLIEQFESRAIRSR